jgi:hypothetical protein
MAVKPRKCWWCDHFFHTITGTNQGQCRRFAPSGFDTNINSATSTQTTTFGSDIAYPAIYEATVEWCGDFKPKSGDVPEPSEV